MPATPVFPARPLSVAATRRPRLHTHALWCAATATALALSPPALAQDAAPAPDAQAAPAAEDARPPEAQAEHAAQDTPAPPAPPAQDAPEPVPAEDEDLEDPAWADALDEEALKNTAPQSPPAPASVDFATTVKSKRHEGMGTTSRVSRAALEQREPDDIHRALSTVPGVYVREEDGLGLRPNIGMRGVDSNRSAKITLLEDGVLIAPAPYAAPAAYAFPLVTRMVGIEVQKGAAGLSFGPQTVAGAVNMISRPVPGRPAAGLDFALGERAALKSHAWAGTRTPVRLGSTALGHVGVLLEGATLGSNGFKTVDGMAPGTGADTARYDLHGKLRWDGALHGWALASELKLTAGAEDSQESYLGLTDGDFESTPYRRYAATALDRMTFTRHTGHVRLSAGHADVGRVVFTAYRSDIQRTWQRVGGFRGGPDINAVLANPDAGSLAVRAAVLRGDVDSEGRALSIPVNARSFVAQGLDLRFLSTPYQTGPIAHRTEAGVRGHADRVHRKHDDMFYEMVRGTLVQSVDGEAPLADHVAYAEALSSYVMHTARWGALSVSPGLRVESVWTRFDDDLTASETSAHRTAWLPGAEARFTVLDPGAAAALKTEAASLAVHAGVHRGFSPVAPGQDAAVQPESSVNSVLGLQGSHGWAWGAMRMASFMEVAGFYTLYENLSGICTFSQGCAQDALGTQFNAGAFDVGGAEVQAGLSGTFRGLRVGLDVAYTFTDSAARTAFDSPNPHLNRVEPGDALPGIPLHQLGALLSARTPRASAWIAPRFQSATRTDAGAEPVTSVVHTPAYTVVDLGTAIRLTPADDALDLQVYFKVTNALDTVYMASRQPFGARPGAPRWAWMGLKASL